MNQWLKLALSSLAIAVVAVSGVITMPATPAVANEEAASETAAPTIIHGARNSSLWVGADAIGALMLWHITMVKEFQQPMQET